MLGINPISYTNALATSRIEPTYTVPVQPVHRIEGYSTHIPVVEKPSNNDKAFEATLNSYIEKYKDLTHIELPQATPYEQAVHAMDASAIVGMNFDISV
ncbi:MAG: hypothetical protein E7262_11375 [Lachnospiraceae bacterium]|nr:hypothetical protein [Lachnospiraceae bacterium]